jgi:hypothetical protein
MKKDEKWFKECVINSEDNSRESNSPPSGTFTGPRARSGIEDITQKLGEAKKDSEATDPIVPGCAEERAVSQGINNKKTNDDAQTGQAVVHTERGVCVDNKKSWLGMG